MEPTEIRSEFTFWYGPLTAHEGDQHKLDNLHLIALEPKEICTTNENGLRVIYMTW